MNFELPTFTVSGTPDAMGRQYGAHFREMIQAFVADRVKAVETYLMERGYAGLDPLFEAGEACLEQVRGFDPEGHAEHLGIAAGSGVDPVRLFTTANMTDIRDILILPSDIPAEDEGCTVALLPPDISENGHGLQGQTWDLNGPDVDYVVAVHRLPDVGPETWSVTCAGCQTLMGMNAHGVTVGTTNLKTRGARIGVPYLSVLHKAIKQPSLKAASTVVGEAPVAGSHSYFVGDGSEAIEWERTPSSADSRTTQDGPIVRSNHCLIDTNVALECDLSPSTHERFARMEKLLAQSNDHSVQSLKSLFADRSDGPKSINRIAEDNSGATTNAVVAMNPAALEFEACRGQADRGIWKRLEFGS